MEGAVLGTLMTSALLLEESEADALERGRRHADIHHVGAQGFAEETQGCGDVEIEATPRP